MAFSLRALCPINPSLRGGVPVEYVYVTEDATADVDTSGYFNDAHTLFEVNDIIRVYTTSSGVLQYAGYHVVLSNSNGVVDVSDIQKVITTIPNDTD